MGLQPYLIPLITVAASFIAAGTINLILKILIKKAEKTNIKYDIMPLITGLGIAGLTIALAARNVLSKRIWGSCHHRRSALQSGR